MNPSHRRDQWMSSMEYVNEKPKPTRKYNPLPRNERKKLAAALTSTKSVDFGQPAELSEPKKRYTTKSDGSCYFRSISYTITGSEKSHTTIRDRVVEHMNKNLNAKLAAYLDKNVDEYLSTSKMSQDGVWATDAEIMATASLIGSDIVVYAKAGQTMQWLRYPASFSLQKQTDHAIYLENQCEHFNVVISV